MAPRFLLFHQPDHGAAAEKRGGEVCVDDGLPVRQGKVFQLVAVQAAACDVDQGIDAAVRGDDFFKGRIDRGFFGQVGWKKR